MKRLYILVLLILASTLSACRYEYDISELLDGEYTPQVVFESIITPDSTIYGTFYWSREVGSKEPFKPVELFDVKLYEDDNLIIDGSFSEGVLVTDIYPKSGARYSIEIYVPNYGEVSATTTVPHPVTFDIAFNEVIYADGNYPNFYNHYTISDIDNYGDGRAVWLNSYLIYKNVEVEDGGYNPWLPPIENDSYVIPDTMKTVYFYATNYFCDQVNSNGDDGSDGNNIMARGSIDFYEQFIRIPQESVVNALPLNFSIRAHIDRTSYSSSVNSEGVTSFFPNSSPLSEVHLLLIAPSDDYDKYYRSLYKQITAIDGIFHTNIPLSTNINNGLGIFAGYSTTTYKHKIEEEIWLELY